jgi:hypothetical protein
MLSFGMIRPIMNACKTHPLQGDNACFLQMMDNAQQIKKKVSFSSELSFSMGEKSSFANNDVFWAISLPFWVRCIM